MVTLTQIDTPSRSKMAGPCWIAIGDIYATSTPATLNYQPGDQVAITGKATLRRASGRADVQRKSWTVTVTGNPDDMVTLSVGSPQSVVATLTGVVE